MASPRTQKQQQQTTHQTSHSKLLDQAASPTIPFSPHLTPQHPSSSTPALDLHEDRKRLRRVRPASHSFQSRPAILSTPARSLKPRSCFPTFTPPHPRWPCRSTSLHLTHRGSHLTFTTSRRPSTTWSTDTRLNLTVARRGKASTPGTGSGTTTSSRLTRPPSGRALGRRLVIIRAGDKADLDPRRQRARSRAAGAAR